MLQTNPTTLEHGIPALVVSATGKPSLEFDLMGFFRQHDELDKLYTHINKYLGTLDEKVQEGLYQIFSEVSLFTTANHFAERESVAYIEERLDLAAGLLDLQNFTNWFHQNHEGLPIPDTVFDTFTEDLDMGITRDKTYVTKEYIDLIGLILFIRMLAPVYLEYLTYAKETSKHPYYLIFRLFIGSCIDHPETSLGKLKEYVDVNYASLFPGNSKNEHLVVTAGLSDDDIVDYLIAEVIFNKLLTIEFFSTKCNAVSYIFQTIRFKGKFTSTGSNLRASSSRGGSEREDYSYFEDYRKTTTIPIGTVVEIQHALSNLYKLASDLGLEDFDFKLYEQELKHIGKLTEERPANVQIYLLGWFLHKVINPRALFHLENRKIVELLIFAKVALLNTNQSFIGIFLTSLRGDESQFMNIVIRNTLNKHLISELRPHFRYVMGEERGSVIESTISEIAKEMSNSVWNPVGTLGNTRGVVTEEGYIDLSSNVNDIVTSYVAYVLGNTNIDVA